MGSGIFSQYILKLTVAIIAGGLIGIERSSLKRPAGLRTHILVAVGACVTMMISFEIGNSINLPYTIDPTRLGAQVISGVGFLGVGTIIRDGTSIKGLTTAASLWVVACIGLAVGSGLYLLGLTAAGIVYFVLHGLGYYEMKVGKKKHDKDDCLSEEES